MYHYNIAIPPELSNLWSERNTLLPVYPLLEAGGWEERLALTLLLLLARLPPPVCPLLEAGRREEQLVLTLLLRVLLHLPLASLALPVCLLVEAGGREERQVLTHLLLLLPLLLPVSLSLPVHSLQQAGVREGWLALNLFFLCSEASQQGCATLACFELFGFCRVCCVSGRAGCLLVFAALIRVGLSPSSFAEGLRFSSADQSFCFAFW